MSERRPGVDSIVGADTETASPTVSSEDEKPVMHDSYAPRVSHHPPNCGKDPLCRPRTVTTQTEPSTTLDSS